MSLNIYNMFLTNFNQLFKKDVLNLLEFYNNNKTFIQRIIYVNIISFMIYFKSFCFNFFIFLLNFLNEFLSNLFFFMILNIFIFCMYFFVYKKLLFFKLDTENKNDNYLELIQNIMNSSSIEKMIKNISQTKPIDTEINKELELNEDLE